MNRSRGAWFNGQCTGVTAVLCELNEINTQKNQLLEKQEIPKEVNDFKPPLYILIACLFHYV